MKQVRRKLAGLVLVTCLFALPLGIPSSATQAQTPDPQGTGPRVTDDLLAEFAALVQAEMATYHIPGAAVAVVQDGDILFADGFGYRNLAEQTPFTAQTRFRIGSTTKSMTSFLIAQLVDEGALSWDTPVIDLLPDFQTSDPALTPLITIRDLLSMSTGLAPDQLAGMYWGSWTVDDILATVAALPVAGERGAYYAYNNEAYATAGYAALVAAGEPPTLDAYKALLQARVFDPVGMPSAIVTDDPADLGADYATAYQLTLTSSDLDQPYAAGFPPIGVVAPAGGVWTTVEDMARYLITQLHGGVTPDGTRLVSEEALAETWRQQVPMDLEAVMDDGGYAMGWVVGAYQGVPVRLHDGGWTGYLSIMLQVPEADAGLVIFTNHMFGGTFTWSLAFRFVELLYGLEPLAIDGGHEALAGMTGPLEAQLPFMPAPEVAPEAVADWLGEYEHGWTLSLREGDQLWLAQGGWEMLLLPLPADTFLVANADAAGAMIRFTEEDDQVVLTVALGELVMRLAKVG